MARKRLNGEGSWGSKTIKGVEYVYFRDSSKHYTYGRSQKEVKEKLELAKQKKEKQEHEIIITNKITFGEYVTCWLYKKKFSDVGLSLEATTFDCYEAALTNRFFKYPIADMQLSALDSSVFKTYLKSLAKKYSHGSIKKTWQVLAMALEDDEFEMYQYLPSINISKVKIPGEGQVAVKKKKISFTSNEDMETLYNEALRKDSKGKYYYGNAARLLAFIMYSGLRVAEASGLQWKDVDMKNDMITISQTYNQIYTRDEYGNKIGTAYVTKAPKTESSTATIPYRERGRDIIQIMNDMYPKHKPKDFVFLTETNTAFTKRHVNHTLKRMLKNSGLEEKEYTVHELRHGYGSILKQQGADIYSISKLLRHSDIKTTANIYVDTTPEALKNILSSLDKKPQS